MVDIACLSPHIFIHYEGKLRIKQFLELCARLIDGFYDQPITTAISKYEEIVGMCEKFLGGLKAPETVGEANEKRKTLIAILQRSKELEMDALKEISSVIQ